MATSTPKTWLDSPNTTTPISAAALIDMEDRLAGPYVNVKWYGAQGDTDTDDTDAIQAAIDSLEATGGTVYFPPGEYKLTSGITYPSGVSLVGAGVDASRLRWTASIGAGLYGIGPAEAAGTYNFNVIEHLNLRGPAYGLSQTMGTAVTTMRGLRLGRRTRLYDCRIQGFHSGVAFGEDHSYASDCDITGNHYNLVWISTGGVARWGNHTVNNCDLAGATMASVAVEDGSLIDAGMFSNCHMGLAPYAFYAPPGRTETRFLINSVLLNTVVEDFGNAVIYSPNTGDLIQGLTVIAGGAGDQNDAFRISGITYDYNIDVGEVFGLYIDSEWFDTTPALGWIHASGSYINDVRLRRCTNNLLAAAASGKPILKCADGSAPILCRWSSGEASGRFMRSAAALTAGQHAKVTGRDTCTLYGTGDGATGVASAGLAKHACGAGEAVALVTSGYAGNIGIAGAAIDAGRLLKPDTGTAGRLIHATDGADGPIVAVSMTSQASAGSTFQVEMRSGAWVG